MKFGLGQSVPRLEDPRLLSGAGRYTMTFPFKVRYTPRLCAHRTLTRR